MALVIVREAARYRWLPEYRRMKALEFAFQWAHGTYESTDTLIGQAEFYAEYLKSGKVPE